MKQTTSLKVWLLLCALLVGSVTVRAIEVKTLTYTITNSVTRLQGQPDRVEASYTSTGSYSDITKLSSGQSMSLTLSGFNGDYRIIGISLRLKTNASSGKGTATAKIGDTTIASYTIPTLGSTEQKIELDVTATVCTDLNITIAATANNVFCSQMIVTYATYDGTDGPVNTINLNDTYTITNFSSLTSTISGNNGYRTFYDDSSNTFTWLVYQCAKINYLHLSSTPGYIQAYVNSPAGFTLTLAYDTHTALVDFDEQSISASDDDQTTFIINKGSGLLTIKAGNDYCRIISMTLTPHPTTSFTISEACTSGDGNFYGTYSNDNAFIVPDGVTVSSISLVDNKISLTDYTEGDIVAAGEGVLVSSTTPGEKTIGLTPSTGTSLTGNLLQGSGDNAVTAATMNDADYYFYHLTMSGSEPGFWWKAEGGAGFDIAAHKAYLKVAKTTNVRGFNLDDLVTGIGQSLHMSRPTATQNFFDLQGRRVHHPVRGLYIVDGRKVCIQ